MKKFKIDFNNTSTTMPFRFQTVLMSCLIILPYFLFSIGITFYQRWFLQVRTAARSGFI